MAMLRLERNGEIASEQDGEDGENEGTVPANLREK
jgi:hypothetical protein